MSSIQDWAGPAWAEMNDRQRARLEEIGEQVTAQYPDSDDQPLRDAALSAAVQYMLGETSPEEFGNALAQARSAVNEATAAARQAVGMAREDGMPETEAARRFGLNRMTIRSWGGKR